MAASTGRATTHDTGHFGLGPDTCTSRSRRDTIESAPTQHYTTNQPRLLRAHKHTRYRLALRRGLPQVQCCNIAALPFFSLSNFLPTLVMVSNPLSYFWLLPRVTLIDTLFVYTLLLFLSLFLSFCHLRSIIFRLPTSSVVAVLV